MSKRSKLVVALIALASLIGAAALLAADRTRRANPTLRPPATWSKADLDLVFDPNSPLHWCNGNHGHVGHRGPASSCKGHVAQAIAALERGLPRSDWVERKAVELIDHPDSEVASRAAEVVGHWELAEAEPALRARIDSVLASPPGSGHDEGTMVVWCCAWALEQLGAKEALPTLRRALARYPEGYVEHAVAAIASGTGDPVPSPHRK